MDHLTRPVQSHLFFALLFGPLLFFIPFRTQGQPATPAADANTVVDRLVQELALDRQLTETPDDIRGQFEQNPLQLPTAQNQHMLQAYGEAFKKAALLQDFKTELNQRIDDGRAASLTDWLERAYVQTIAEAEQEYYTLQGKRKRVVTMYEMEQQPPSEQWVQLIAAITDTTSAAGSTVESSVIILRAVIKALGTLSPQRDFSESQIDMIASNFRSQLESQASQQVQSKLMITYYNVDTNVLEQYLSFWQTDTGQWLDQTISQSMQAAYRSATERFLSAIQPN